MDPKGFTLSRKAAINESGKIMVGNKRFFSSVLADCKFFLSLSFYRQLAGNKTSSLEHDLLTNAIKYCKEAIDLNPNLSQAYYHLAKYYSYKEDFELSLSFLKKAIEIDRVYAIHVFNDRVFKKNISNINELILCLKNSLHVYIEPYLLKFNTYISELKSKGILQFKNLYDEFKEIAGKISEANKHFDTDTYFGYDDCRKIIEIYKSNELQELSRKLDLEISLKEECAKRDLANRSESVNIGVGGAIIGIVVGALVGFIIMVIASTLGLDKNLFSVTTLYTILTIVILITAFVGAVIGYKTAYRSKRIQTF